MNDFPFVEKMKKIQQSVLKFIEDDSNAEENYENLLTLLRDQQITNSPTEFKMFLILICKISENHFRDSFFHDKIYRLLQNYLTGIQKYFSNDEIFYIFNKNKLLLLFLIENKIFQINEKISTIIVNDKYFKTCKYPQYFYPEIKDFTDIRMKTISEDFEETRKKGENDSEISELIRNDRIEEFIIYVNKNDYSINSNIQHSIFETNPLLFKRQSNLIEYSAFFGSIQIFKYLYLNEVKLTSTLWIYEIHGNQPEIIHILEEKKILPPNKNYTKCLLESIKCFHISIANYIQSNYINSTKKKF